MRDDELTDELLEDISDRLVRIHNTLKRRLLIIIVLLFVLVLTQCNSYFP